MKNFKKIFRIVVIALIASACTTNNNNSSVQTEQNKRDTVYIQAMTFHPDTIMINKGDTIVWINNGIVAHDISRYPDKVWHSDTIEPHQTFEKVFDDSTSYFCSIHPTMKGLVLMND